MWLADEIIYSADEIICSADEIIYSADETIGLADGALTPWCSGRVWTLLGSIMVPFGIHFGSISAPCWLPLGSMCCHLRAGGDTRSVRNFTASRLGGWAVGSRDYRD